MNPGVADPAARLKEQETDGIIGEVMYPSINMAAFAYPERDVVQAVFQRHNDWIRDYSSHAPQRLVGIGCLPLPDVDAAIQEQRVARMGIRGVSIPCTALDKPYHHPDYEPFWCAAEEAGIPISAHLLRQRGYGPAGALGWSGPGIVGYTMAPAVASWPRSGNSSAVASPPVTPSQICLC